MLNTEPPPGGTIQPLAPIVVSERRQFPASIARSGDFDNAQPIGCVAAASQRAVSGSTSGVRVSRTLV
jgi:hypothetical protein